MCIRDSFILFFLHWSVSAVGFSGQVIGWGFNLAGEATGISSGNPPGTPNDSTGCVMIANQVLSDVVAISAGTGHSLALKTDGTVVGFGNNSRGEALGFRT